MKPIIAMQTDFGVGGGSTMRGTCLKVDPELEVYEISHSIEKFNIKAAARSLYHIVPYWPAGTVFVSVIDPGVGTSRRASVALLNNGSYVVTPDNGALTLLLESPGIRAVRTIDETVNRLKGTEKVKWWQNALISIMVTLCLYAMFVLGFLMFTSAILMI